MTTISCPRCTATFETQATTATRCRSCGTVVHLGRRTGAHRAPSAWSAEDPGEDEDGTSGTVVVILIAVAVGVGIYLYVRARRRRKAAEEQQRDGDAAVSDVVNPGEPSS